MLTLTMLFALVAHEVPDSGIEINPRIKVSTVKCVTVADCWLDKNGAAVARPAKFKGKPFPKNSCSGSGLLCLRHKLTCEQNLCVSQDIGDRC